jgi:hypothetical protein
MHIGSKVAKADLSDSFGIVMERPAIHECWRVTWFRGEGLRGTTGILHENELTELNPTPPRKTK